MDTNDDFASPQASEQSAVQKSIYLLFFSLIAILVASTRWKFCIQRFLPHQNHASKHKTRTPPAVPFILIRKEGDKHPSRTIQKSLEKYSTDAYQALRGLSQQMDQAIELEHGLEIHQAAKLSTKIQGRIQQLSSIFDHNEHTLRNLLQSVDFITSLPDHRMIGKDESSNGGNQGYSERTQGAPYSLNHPSTIPHSSKRNASLLLEQNVYDTTAQIVAHLVRDWCEIGASIRESLYGWVCQELVQRSSSRHHRKDPVLVPGAGMGRLAYDIHSHGFTVEANEISPVMGAAAKSILTKNASGMIHPYALDPMTNEVDSSRRYDKVWFPDLQVVQMSPEVSLSFTIGDFVGTYYSQQVSTFGAVATCFFIDTATDIYEYILLIKRLLKPKGIWVNVGPVQWHVNALLRPSADELKDLILNFGFQIASWSVDEKPVPYRQDVASDRMDSEPFVRSTSFEAYRPLRFVAIRE